MHLKREKAENSTVYRLIRRTEARRKRLGSYPKKRGQRVRLREKGGKRAGRGKHEKPISGKEERGRFRKESVAGLPPGLNAGVIVCRSGTNERPERRADCR